MIYIEGTENIGFSANEVFEAVILKENWPTVEGVSLLPVDDKLAINGILKFGLQVPLVNINLGINGKVDEFEPGKLITVKGSGRMASTIIRLVLESEKQDNTNLDYSVKLNVKPITMRWSEPAIGKYVKQIMPQCMADFNENITKYLTNQ